MASTKDHETQAPSPSPSPARTVSQGLTPPLKRKGLLSGVSKIGVFFGLVLALPLVAVAALEALLVWKVMENDSHAFIQQAIGDTTLVLASHFKGDFGRLSERLTALGYKVHGRKGGTGSAHDSSGTVLDSFEFDQPFLDLAVFGRGEQLSVFDVDQVAQRVYWSLNSRYASFSQDLVKQVEDSDAEEKRLIRGAFQGHTVLGISSPALGKRGVALLAVPLINSMSSGAVDEVIVTHLRLDLFGTILRREAMVSSALVDEVGNILVHADTQLVGRAKVNTLPLFKSMRASKVAGGQVTYEDGKGQSFWGGYQKVGFGGLAVLASISEEEATSSLRTMRKQLLFFLSASFFLLFATGYLIANRFDVSPILSKGGVAWSVAELSEITRTGLQVSRAVTPKKMVLTLLYGSLRQPAKVLEGLSPEEGIEIVNEFFEIASSAILRQGGTFEIQSGTAFLGIFNQTDGTQIPRALRSLFRFRSGIVQLNASRKVEGRKAIYASVGVDTGEMLVGKMGGESKATSIVGDTLQSAKGLDHLTAQVGTDVLVSQDVWRVAEKEFIGEALGEAKLVPTAAVCTYYSLKGYRDEHGKETLFDGEVFPPDSEKAGIQDGQTVGVAVATEQKPLRWSVNNGSQIVGPLTPEEIASCLFAQELDFDCECWAEGTGKSALIKSAGIFLGSEDADAKLWTYDGKMIQGPFSPGFLKTALLHGAMPYSSLVCEESTIQGWKKLDDRPDLVGAPAAASVFPPKNALAIRKVVPPPFRGPTSKVSTDQLPAASLRKMAA